MICTKEYRLRFTRQAKEIVSQMTLEEKVRLMAGDCGVFASFGVGSYNTVPYSAGGCPRLGVPKMRFCDGPRGVVSGRSTCFPVSMARGAAFDPELEERIGNAIGREVRANGGNFFGGVCVNVPYHPGDGRSQEVYGEDPVHMGIMGEALVKGVQNQNVIACIKHYAFNSMENARFYVNITADKRTEREIYLRQFKRCVDAGAAAVMSAYNRYQGTHCGHSRYLLRKVLKGEWGFDGFVVSDFFLGVRSAAGGIRGGLDVEMNVRLHYTVKNIRRALKAGKIRQEEIDEAALRIVRTLLAFEAAEDSQEYPASLLACPAHVALAREAAEKSITLLQNRRGLLPLNAKAVKRLALVGDLAAIENIGDHGSSQVRPPYVKTLKRALEEQGVAFDWIPTKEAVKQQRLIQSADAVILVCGCRYSDEGEYIFIQGGDRKNLGLHKKEVELIRLAGALNPNTAVVLMGGNMIRVHEWRDDVAAILMAYYPGMEGGAALADLLFGRVNPSGKLPFVVGKSDDDFPEMHWHAAAMRYGYYHGYQKLDREKRGCDFPYGFGLSYTSFQLTDAALVQAGPEEAVFQITVTNTGERAGDEVVQLYAGWENSAVDRPERALQAFRRVSLAPGAQSVVVLTLRKADLAYYDAQAGGWKEEDIRYTAYLGTDEQACLEHPIPFRFATARE